MANIRPFDLPPATEVPSSAAFVIDTGAVVQKASAEQIVDSAIPLATQAEAEAGSGNDTRMSPLRVQQAINAQALSPDFLSGPDGAEMVGLEQGGTVQQAISWVTPQMFGAVAGVATVEQARLNRAAFNAAIAFLYDAGGGVLRVPAGKFHVAAEETPAVFTDGYIYMKSGVRIVGDGMDSTYIIRGSAQSIFTNSPSEGGDYTHNGEDMGVSFLTIDGNPAAHQYPANLVFLSCASNLHFDNVRFLNTPGLHALDLNAVKDIHINRCRFEGNDTSLTEAFGGGGYRPESIQITSLFTTGGAPLPCDTVRIRDCYFGPSSTEDAPMCSIGNHTVSNGWNATDVIVDGCVMEGMLWFGIRPFCWRGGVISNSRFLNCVDAGIYIQSANNSYGMDGEPTGTPASNSAIIIENNEIIDAGNTPIAFSPGGGDSVSGYARVQGAIVRGNRITDSAPKTGSPLIFAAWVDGLEIEANAHQGVRRRAVDQRFCAGVICKNNSFDTYEVDSVTINETGSVNENTWQDQGLSTNIRYEANTFKGSGFYGINMMGSLSRIIISNNIIYGVGDPNPRPAIVLQPGISKAVVEGNILDGSNGGMTIGVDVRAGATDVRVSDNQVNGATTAPVSHAGTGTVSGSGAGTPEGSIIAPVGSTWTRTDGGAGTTMYVKETGTGNTGWVAK